MRTGPAGYALAAGAVAAGAGAAGLLPLAAWRAALASFAAAGWALMSAAGIGFGTWLAREHARPGGGFLAAMAAGMLGRLILAGAGGLAALSAGRHAAYAYAFGLCLGFVPLQALEIAWFSRTGSTEPRKASPS